MVLLVMGHLKRRFLEEKKLELKAQTVLLISWPIEQSQGSLKQRSCVTFFHPAHVVICA